MAVRRFRTSPSLVVLASLLSLLIFAGNAGAKTIYVRPQPSGTQDGLRWETAFATLQAAIDAAEAGDQVWVAEGRYDEPRHSVYDGINTGSVVMKDGVHLFGGFHGDEISLEKRDWVRFPAIIDGSRARGGAAAYIVIVGAAGATLDGFVVTGATMDFKFEGTGGMRNVAVSPYVAHCTFRGNYGYAGGGLSNTSGAAPTIYDCVFENNVADRGGGIYNRDSAPVLVDCLFSENTAFLGGGAVFNNRAFPTIIDCQFVDNCVSFGSGGAIANYSSEAHIATSLFTGNACSAAGGALEDDKESASIIVGSLFSRNAASSGGALRCRRESGSFLYQCFLDSNSAHIKGGALHVYDSSPIVLECAFSGNGAEMGGAVLVEFNSLPLFYRSSFFGNSALLDGGAVHHESVLHFPSTFANCVVAGNSAGRDGGAFFVEASSPWLNHCSLVANRAGRHGAALEATTLYSAWVSEPRVYNSLLWDNGDAAISTHEEARVDLRYSLSSNQAEGPGNVHVAPHFTKPEAADFSLLPGSPGIDAGGIEFGLPDDFRGIPRPQGGGMDMGAFESISAPPPGSELEGRP